MDKDTFASNFPDVYVAFLKDPEPEVRTVAAGNVADFGALLPVNTILTSLVPAIKDLSTDISQHVRGLLPFFLIYTKKTIISYLF